MEPYRQTKIHFYWIVMIQPSIFGAPSGGQPINHRHFMWCWSDLKKKRDWWSIDRLGHIRGSAVVFIVAICYNDGPCQPCHKLYLVEVVINGWSLQWLGCLQLPQVVGATACDPGYSMPMPIYGMFPPMWGMKAAVSFFSGSGCSMSIQNFRTFLQCCTTHF